LSFDSGAGNATASSPITSVSPGFQPWTSLAKNGSGANQLGPDRSASEGDRVSMTYTRPVNGSADTDLSKVRWNASSCLSAAVAVAHGTNSTAATRARRQRGRDDIETTSRS